mgnify:FL=1
MGGQKLLLHTHEKQDPWSCVPKREDYEILKFLILVQHNIVYVGIMVSKLGFILEPDSLLYYHFVEIFETLVKLVGQTDSHI